MAKGPYHCTIFKAFGAAIKAARNEYGESRKKVSDKLSISLPTLRKIQKKGDNNRVYRCSMTL